MQQDPGSYCWDPQVCVAWNEELDQEHMDSDRNRDTVLREKNISTARERSNVQ